MTDKTTINQIVWKACDVLRGSIDSTQYKDYILTLLFVKYVSDSYRELHEELLAKYRGDEERARHAIETVARFNVPERSRFEYLYRHRDGKVIDGKRKGVGELIDEGLAELELANPGKLSSPDGGSIFQSISFNSSNLGNEKDKATRLGLLLDAFNDSRLDLRPSQLDGNDVIGDAYEYLISEFAEGAGKKAGEFYTPPEVSELVARLADPQPGARICDPTCGSGSLLLRTAAQVRKHFNSNNFSLYGQENNGATWALAVMNMFLHGVDSATIRWGDTLRSPKLLEHDRLMQFDVVVANPPFSLKNWGHADLGDDRHARFGWGLPTRSKGDYAFLSHMLSTTKRETGRMAVVVPHGVLFRSGSEGKIRRQLIEQYLLDAVIGLPSNLFFGTGIPAAILVFDRAREAKAKEEILFIDASAHFAAGKNQNKLRESDLQRIVGLYQRYRQDEFEPGVVEDKYAYLAPLSEMRENDFNLNIPRYVDTFEPEPLVDMAAVNARLRETRRELVEVEARMEEILETLGLG